MSKRRSNDRYIALIKHSSSTHVITNLDWRTTWTQNERGHYANLTVVPSQFGIFTLRVVLRQTRYNCDPAYRLDAAASNLQDWSAMKTDLYNYHPSEHTRFTYSKTLKASILNFRTAFRSVTRMYAAHSGIDSGIGRESISKKTYTVFTYITSVNT